MSVFGVFDRKHGNSPECTCSCRHEKDVDIRIIGEPVNNPLPLGYRDFAIHTDKRDLFSDKMLCDEIQCPRPT